MVVADNDNMQTKKGNKNKDGLSLRFTEQAQGEGFAKNTASLEQMVWSEHCLYSPLKNE